MSYALGELIKAKPIERKMTQRRLAQLLGVGPSYISYLILGVNPTAKSKKFLPGVDAVKNVSTELGIPFAEALEAAGYDPKLAADRANRDAPGIGGVHPGSDDLFEIAFKAALKAIRAPEDAPADDGGRVVERKRFNVAGEFEVVLLGSDHDWTKDDIALLKKAFSRAYRSVKELIQK